MNTNMAEQVNTLLASIPAPIPDAAPELETLFQEVQETSTSPEPMVERAQTATARRPLPYASD